MIRMNFTGMNFKSFALVASIVEKLNNFNSWCSETHIQKTIFFLQGLFDDMYNYRYILYMYGPFSFELRNDLGKMLSLNILTIEPKGEYGPKILLGEYAKFLEERFEDFLKSKENKINFITKRFSSKTAKDLEALATMFYIVKYKNIPDERNQIKYLMEIKPWITNKIAKETYKNVNNIINEAKNIIN